ncbi:MAG: ATP-binding protein [Candidatus Cloacimonetes bacterium]|nr:ATP-binding protein [Candidatus Cloacimonadota bacterium]
MQDISLHLLDIIENSVRAKARNIWIIITILEPENLLRIIIKDDGFGMDNETLQAAQDPFYTSKTERLKKVGLGIPLFKENAERCAGSFKIESVVSKGTVLTAEFAYDHIDRMPLGMISDTILTAVLGHEQIDLHLKLQHCKIDGSCLDFKFSTELVKKELGDIPLSYPDVITFLDEMLKEGIKNTEMEEN